MSRKSAIQRERALDPEGLGYNFNDVSDAVLMNSTATGRTVQRGSLSSGELVEAVLEDTAEYTALSAAAKKIVDVAMGAGDLDISPGSATRAALLVIFPAPSTIRERLIAMVTVTVSRAAELGFGKVYSRDFVGD